MPAPSQAPSRVPPARPRPQAQNVYDRYVPLVRRIAIRTLRTVPSSITFDDLLSAGWVGMAEVLQRRSDGMDDEEFEAYAAHRVRGAILDYLRGLDPLSRKLRGSSRRLGEAVRELTQQLGRLPGEDELAAELGLRLSTYQELLGEISEAGSTPLELLPGSEPIAPELSPEAATARSELQQVTAAAIAELPERLQLVLGMYYQSECSLREIGEVLGVTESRVCQLHSEAVQLIRARIDGQPRRRRR